MSSLQARFWSSCCGNLASWDCVRMHIAIGPCQVELLVFSSEVMVLLFRESLHLVAGDSTWVFHQVRFVTSYFVPAAPLTRAFA